MSNITITLTGANNDSIVFNEANEDYVVAQGLTGFGMNDLNVRIDEGSGDGGRFISSRTITRSITMPIYILGSDRADVESKYRTLTKILDNKLGPVTITAKYPDDSEWFIEGYRMGGGDVTYGKEANITYLYTVIEIRAPYPYWTSTTVNEFTVSGISYDINNTGDVDTYVRWEVTGPFFDFTLSNDNGTLEFIRQTNPVETVVIDTQNATVSIDNSVTMTSANGYGFLAGVPKMFKIPVGTSTINIDLNPWVIPGYTPEVKGYWQERREVIF